MARKKPKTKPRDNYDDDDGDVAPKRKSRRARDDDDDRPKGPPNDAYTGLAFLTLVALIGAGAFFYLDAEAVTAQPLNPPSVTIPALVPGTPS